MKTHEGNGDTRRALSARPGSRLSGVRHERAEVDRTPASSGGSTGQTLRLSDDEPLGVPLGLVAPVVLIGLGTTGIMIVQSLISWLRREAGGLVPRSVGYIMVDSATAPEGIDLDHFKNVTGECAGENGAGTDPNNGEEAIHRNYGALQKMLSGALKRLDSNDPHLRVSKSVRECVDFYLIAGQGATGGGGQSTLILLCHDVARTWGIETPRVHLKFLGAEMSLRDVTRTPSDEQQIVVRDTSAQNQTYYLAHHHSSELTVLSPPVGQAFSLPASQLTHEVSVIDQSNPHHRYPTTGDFIDGVARGLATSVFTAVQKDIEDRAIDLHLRTSGRGRWS